MTVNPILLFALSLLGVVLLGCSDRVSGPMTSVGPGTECYELLHQPRVDEPPAAGVMDTVWLITQPALDWAPVVNFNGPRANGQPGYQVSFNGQSWSVFSSENARGSFPFAMVVDQVSTGRLDGRLLVCELGDSDPAVAQPLVAQPLAPTTDVSTGVSLSARYPAVDAVSPELNDIAEVPSQTWWPAERSSDLALLNALWLVVARGPDGLRMLDVSQADLGRLGEVAHVLPAPGDDYNDVVVLDTATVAVASRSKGLVVYDVSQPETPTLVDESLPLEAPRDGHNVFVADNRLYLAQAPASGTGALTAFDITEPTRPTTLWRSKLQSGHDAHDVFVAAGTAYVSSLRGGLYLLDASTGAFLGRYPMLGAHSAATLPAPLGEQRVLVTEEKPGGRLRQLSWSGLDIGRSESLDVPQTWSVLGESVPGETDAGASGLIRSAAAPHKLQCVNSTCFVAFYQMGLRVLEFAGQEPLLRASFPTWSSSAAGERNWLQGATGVALQLPWIYVLDTVNGVLALRLTHTTRSPSSSGATTE